jgi:hypothetical protein
MVAVFGPVPDGVVMQQCYLRFSVEQQVARLSRGPCRKTFRKATYHQLTCELFNQMKTRDEHNGR